MTSALLFAWWTGVASAATGGTIEICKHGQTTATFTFTVQKGLQTPQTVQVPANQGCVPVSVPTGTIKVTENLTGSDGLVYSQQSASTTPSGALISQNPNTAMIKVAVSNGDDIILDVTNVLAASTVKICKTSSTFKPPTQYTFTVAGQQVQAVVNGACSDPVAVQAQSVITVQEQVPPGEQVTSIQVTSGSGTIKKQVNAYTIRFVVGNGVNQITFNDEPLPPAQNGLLEICKDAGDQFVKGNFAFTYQPQGQASQTVVGGIGVGQCTPAITVPAGNVTITENPGKYNLGSVVLGPNSGGFLGNVNTINATATVVVPVSDPNNPGSNEVQVHFINVTPTTQLKVCKALAPGSEGLQNVPFSFTVGDDQFPNNTSYHVGVTVPTGATSQCSIVGGSATPVPFPIGSTATVTEAGVGNVDGGSGIGQDQTQTITINPGINEIDFTNTAFGALEICKYMEPGSSDLGQTFTFNYVNTANASVRGQLTTTAGSCTFPVFVPAGNYRVTEDLSKLVVKTNDGAKIPVFQFVASDARGPQGDSRCVPQVSYPAPQGIPPTPIPASGGCGNPLVVSVPWLGQNGFNGETLVNVWNRTFKFSVKVCKTVTSDSTATLRNTTWTYKVTTSSDAVGFTTPAIGNGQCTGEMGNYEVAVQGQNGGLQPNRVKVVENNLPNMTWYVSGISVSNGYDVTMNLGTGTVNYTPGPGPTVPQYSNTACPLGGPCPPV